MSKTQTYTLTNHTADQLKALVPDAATVDWALMGNNDGATSVFTDNIKDPSFGGGMMQNQINHELLERIADLESVAGATVGGCAFLGYITMSAVNAMSNFSGSALGNLELPTNASGQTFIPKGGMILANATGGTTFFGVSLDKEDVIIAKKNIVLGSSAPSVTSANVTDYFAFVEHNGQYATKSELSDYMPRSAMVYYADVDTLERYYSMMENYYGELSSKADRSELSSKADRSELNALSNQLYEIGSISIAGNDPDEDNLIDNFEELASIPGIKFASMPIRGKMYYEIQATELYYGDIKGLHKTKVVLASKDDPDIGSKYATAKYKNDTHFVFRVFGNNNGYYLERFEQVTFYGFKLSPDCLESILA